MLTNRSAPHARVTPVLTVADVREAVAWYCEVLGFVEHVRIGAGHRAQLGLPDGPAAELVVAEVRPGRRLPDAQRSHQVMLKVAGVAEVLERAVARGATVTDPLHDWEYGERQAALDDPFGHQWVLNQTLRDVAPEEWGGETVVGFRLWPPVGVGTPVLAGWLASATWGDPVALGGWRVPLGALLLLGFAGWNGWALWLFARHGTGLLPGQETSHMIEAGPYRWSRNPLYVGLLALHLGLALLVASVWAVALLPVSALLLLWGAILPEERFLQARFGAAYDDYRGRVRRWL